MTSSAKSNVIITKFAENKNKGWTGGEQELDRKSLDRGGQKRGWINMDRKEAGEERIEQRLGRGGLNRGGRAED